MTTSMRRLLPAILAGGILISACSASRGGGGATPAEPLPSPTPSSVPGGSGDASSGGGDGSVGGGVVTSPPMSDGSTLPGSGGPTLVVPKPGRLDVHPVGAAAIDAKVDGRRVIVTLSWWSGVEPCAVLDSVTQVRTGTSIVLTIREGADKLDVPCPAIALLKGTIVDLGELAPGSYTITAGGDAPPVRIVVS